MSANQTKSTMNAPPSPKKKQQSEKNHILNFTIKPLDRKKIMQQHSLSQLDKLNDEENKLDQQKPTNQIYD